MRCILVYFDVVKCTLSQTLKKEKTLESQGLDLVGAAGFEPATPTV